MNFRDLITISSGNLWRMKLRTFLTVSGVIIAIAAFVSMLSFGAGMQKNISREFNELGLFSTMQVYPELPRDADTLETERPPLDDKAIELLMTVPGIKLAYPYDKFSITIKYGDSELTTNAQALSESALKTKLYSKTEAGISVISDSSYDCLVTTDFLEDLNIEVADSVIGQPLIISFKAPSLDSALIHIVKSENWDITDRLEKIQFDSILNAEYRSRVIKKELNAALNRFISGYMNSPNVLIDTLTIKGVLKGSGGRRLRTQPVIIPIRVAQKRKAEGAGVDPTDFLSMMQGGSLMPVGEEEPTDEYSKVTLEIEEGYLYKPIKDSINAIGYRTFSYAEEFEQIEQFFFYFNMGLGIIGLIALVTASLGIINTMVMSIIERRREIGIMKSLGADENYIRTLFLVESGVIGSLGAVVGILFGWVITRIASAIVQTYMENKGVDVMELFALPFWLIAIAFIIGLLVSLLAGFFPASKAARVDPVEALRSN